ncbi:Wzy-type polysaccharide biosynthesis protein UppW [soil metagenome]
MPYKVRNIADFAHPVRLRWMMAAMVGLLTLTLLGPAMTILGDAESGVGNPLRQVGYAIVFILAVVALRPIRHPERLAVVPWPFWLALAWCWVSLAWSLDFGVGVRRLVLTTIIIWSVFAIVQSLGIARTLLFVRIALIVLLIVNLVTVLAFPLIGVHQHEGKEFMLDGKWRGIMGHKNLAGLICALTMLFFAFDRRNLPYAVQAAVLILSAVFLWFSGSKTSLGLVFAAAALGFGIAYFKTRSAGRQGIPPIGRGLLLVGISLALFPLIHWGVQSDAFLNFIADPEGLTGRAEIWAAMMRFYLKDPVFTAGYGSFWNINNVSPILTFGQGWVQQVSEGHNGYLDLLVTIGLPGLVLVLMATLVFPVDRLLTTRSLQQGTCALVAAVLVFCISHNFTESTLFDRDTLGQVFLLVALAILWTGEGQDPAVARRAPKGKARPENPARDMNRRARLRAADPSSRRDARPDR